MSTSFVDRGFGNVHIGRSEGNGNVELWAVYLAPAPAGQPLRIDAAKAAGRAAPSDVRYAAAGAFVRPRRAATRTSRDG